MGSEKGVPNISRLNNRTAACTFSSDIKHYSMDWLYKQPHCSVVYMEVAGTVDGQPVGPSRPRLGWCLPFHPQGVWECLSWNGVTAMRLCHAATVGNPYPFQPVNSTQVTSTNLNQASINLSQPSDPHVLPLVRGKGCPEAPAIFSFSTSSEADDSCLSQWLAAVVDPSS